MRSNRPAAKFAIHALLLALLLPPLPVRGEVAGERVLAGEAHFERAGDVTTIRASDGAIIRYDRLDVRSHEELHFVQPDASSRVLNQVRGDATRIDGGLYANGIVYIVNPAGVFFGGDAVVEVGGLVAAAGHLDHDDFLAGRDRFALEGRVENRGRIEARAVALLGRRVSNHGEIHAPDGTIALVAGEQLVLTRPGGHLHVEVDGAAEELAGGALEHTGLVDAGAGSVRFTTGDVYSLALNHEGITRGGSVELRAASGDVRVAGEIDARGLAPGERGGEIHVTGERVSLEGARLDASGAAGGGDIRVGGDLRGSGELPTARRTAVDADSRLLADAVDAGDGGRVIVWADEATAFLGGISARGGSAGGDGGFAEVSGAVFLWTDGQVDLRAERGSAGTLLYDPQDIEIVGGNADGSDSPDLLADRLAGDGDLIGSVLFGDLGNLDQPFQIFTSEIEGSDADIVLEATNSIFSSETLAIALQTDRSLSLRTRNDVGDDAGSAQAPGIALGDVSFSTSGTGSISLETGTAAAAGVQAGIAVGGLSTEGGAVSLSTLDGAILVDGAINTTPVSGDAGAIQLSAGDLDAAGDSPIDVTGMLDTRGGAGGGRGGDVTVESRGERIDIGGTTNPLRGGGAVALQDVVSRGGDGGAGEDGGRGGDVSIRTDDGAISAGDIDTSGGSGDDAGGRGGAIEIITRDSDLDDANHIVAGTLLTRGGAGQTGDGGVGGRVNVNVTPAEEVLDGDGNTLQEGLGSGDITLTQIVTEGGDSTDAAGGRGGQVFVVVNGVSNSGGLSRVSVGDAVTAAVLASAGDGSVRGGSGPTAFGGFGVAIGTAAGDVELGRVELRGGNATGADALGGNGGSLIVDAGFDADAPAGSLLLLGNVDAREGTSTSVDPERLASVDSGAVRLIAEDGLEHGGQAGPHVSTSGDLTLGSGGDLGAAGTFVVQGEGVRRIVEDMLGNSTFQDMDSLVVQAVGVGDVAVQNAGFLGGLDVTALAAGADVQVVQPAAVGGGSDRVRLQGVGGRIHVIEADGSGNQIDIAVRSANFLEDPTDPTLLIPTDVVVAGAAFEASSDGDLLVGDADGVVIEAGTLLEPDPVLEPGEEPPLPRGADVTLIADRDADGSGAVLDALGSAVGEIVLNPDPPNRESGELFLEAAAAATEAGPTAGIGDLAAPLVISGGGVVRSAVVSPLREAADSDPENPSFEADPDATAGIHLLNRGATELEVGIARIEAGTGRLRLESESADLRITGRLQNRPADPEAGGAGGDIELQVGAPGRIVLDPASPIGSFAFDPTGAPLVSGGRQLWNGSVELVSLVEVFAGGGLEVNGSLDADVDAVSGSLFAALGNESMPTSSLFAGDIGAQRPLDLLILQSFDPPDPDGEGGPDPDPPPVEHAVELDLDSVTTNLSQAYGPDLLLARDARLSSGAAIAFSGDVDAAPGADAALAVDAVGDIGFASDVGELGAPDLLRGLDVSAGGVVSFLVEGDQQVVVGADGISLATEIPGGPNRVPDAATLVRFGGDLTLRSEGGDVLLGDRQKFTATDGLLFEAPAGTVRFTDLNALGAIRVDALDVEVFARAPGEVLLARGGRLRDRGTDIFAPDVELIAANAVQVVGTGETPTIFNVSGSATAPGPLPVAGLASAPDLDDIAPQGPLGTVLDLAQPQVGPGFDTLELDTSPVEVPQELRVSRDAGEPGEPPDPARVVAVLGCDPDERERACPAAADLPVGSPLATPRAADLARRLRAWQGDRGGADRRALAQAAARPGSLLNPDTRPVLLELGRWSTEVGMLGLGPAAEEAARQALLRAMVEAVGSPQLDAARLRSAVEELGLGLRL